ncbi:MAG: hypothetical protein MUC49_19680 [Raineya sp.]|nr:hypothetical protein [Raineya sp.]
MQKIYLLILYIHTSLCLSQKYENIVIISEENSKKADIAKLITIAKNEKARVIGLNFKFNDKGLYGDSLLKKAIKSCPNLIIPVLDINDKKDSIIPINYSDEYSNNANFRNYFVEKKINRHILTLLQGLMIQKKLFVYHI